MAGKLFIVATPIGNLGDFTYRAIETIKTCDYILAESSERTSKLLNQYNLKKKIVTFNKDNENTKLKAIIADLERGKQIALVSDAGTPSISDPGFGLLKHQDKNFSVSPIPGSSSLTSALSVSPIPVNTFSFLGFLPKKTNDLEKRLNYIKNLGMPVIIFENKNRLSSLLHKVQKICGKDTLICIFRELTKLHEEIIFGTVSKLIENSGNIKYSGEFTLIISVSNKESIEFNKLIPKILKLSESYTTKEVVDILHLFCDHPKKELYNFVLNVRQKE